MERLRLIFVGGYLGAGKTTLLAEAARRLVAGGSKVGLVTNDQAAGLVDTEILRDVATGVGEVSGGCLCCRFGDLVTALKDLFRTSSPEIVIAEPVGSCTDISATVLQPMKDLYGEIFDVAPFGVLVDPEEFRRLAAGPAPGDSAGGTDYIFRKQLEEADCIVVNKADLLDEAGLAGLRDEIAAMFPDAKIMAISALTGDGVDEWLDLVMGGGAAGTRVVEVDYDTYADGEAQLGWLNATVALTSDGGADWAKLAGSLLAKIGEECDRIGASIAHVKLHIRSGDWSLAANLTGTGGAPDIRKSSGEPSDEAKLVLNARVKVDPEGLRGVFERSLEACAGEDVSAVVESVESFSPSRPDPEHRYGSVV